MDSATRDAVFARADFRCEYCRIESVLFPDVRFHVEHVIPRQHRGDDSLENLAMACFQCNLHKGPNLAGIDPVTGNLTPLFHPRKDEWAIHFAVRGPQIVGLTAIGRTTVEVLAMNSRTRMRLRRELDSEG